MSEPVTQAEIEDVLSSIRRLVSEDSRTVGAQPGKGVQTALAAQIGQSYAGAPGNGTAKGAPSGGQSVTRLVLTPALRVPENKLAPVDSSTTSSTSADLASSGGDDITDPAHEPTNAADQTDDKVGLDQAGAIEFWEEPEDRVAQGVALHDDDPENEDLAFFKGLAAVTTTTGDEASDDAQSSECVADAEAQPSINREAPWSDPDATLYQAAAGTGHTVEPGKQLIETVTTTKSTSQLNPKVGAVVQKLAEMEAANTASPVLWEPDGTRDTPYAGVDLESLPWEDQDSIEPDNGDTNGAIGRPDQDKAALKDPADEPEKVETQSATAPDETLSGPLAESANGVPIAARPDEGAMSQSTEGRIDQIEASQTETAASFDHSDTLTEAAITDTALDTLDTLVAEESFLDEHALRELVSEIVREELQGPLGERITRNVRKLVRREIHRALSAQNLL
ncbi:hypothetical protein [Phaeobacter sp. C3_T13_0]|uniref:hypothetical protein n=1 Tax=Phaeobacter cretensis TaxID=3342641 RepID=UPI0039BCE078